MKGGMEMKFGSPRESSFRSPARSMYTGTDVDRSRVSQLDDTAEGLVSMSSYQEYPKDQPFIRDSYRRAPNKPVKAYPESNRQAVMLALKGLQAKIRQLEVERTHAESNLKTLSSETSRYRGILQQEQDHTQASQTAVSQQTQEMESQLQSAESRCNLLEKQLDYMRKMVQTAEHDRTDAVRRSTLTERHREETEHLELQTQLDKISDLEREHLKLTATQTLTESKMRELEERLREEKHYRKLMQGKAAELQTAAETNRILFDATAPRVKKVRKKKKKPSTACNKKSRPVADSMDHYRLNLADLPFVAGTSTSPSHSVPANVQRVLSMLKTHNSRLCPTTPNGYLNSHGTSSSSGVSSNASDLNDLMLQLQDEFGHMSFEHQELSQQVQDTRDSRVREDLERELDTLVLRMEAKGDQIARLRRHQNTTTEKKKKKKPAPRPQSAVNLPVDHNGEVQVTTTIKTRGSHGTSVVVRPRTAPGGTNLDLLKDLKKIQTTLRKDDLEWE